MDNLEILKELTQAFNDHDLNRIMSFFDDDCSLDMPKGSEPWGTRYMGKDEVRRGLATNSRLSPMCITGKTAIGFQATWVFPNGC